MGFKGYIWRISKMHVSISVVLHLHNHITKNTKLKWIKMIKPWNIWNGTCLWIFSICKPLLSVRTLLLLSTNSQDAYVYFIKLVHFDIQIFIIPATVNSSHVTTEWSLTCCWTKSPVRSLCWHKNSTRLFFLQKTFRQKYVFKMKSFITLINFELNMFNIIYLLFNAAPLWWET